MGRQEDVRAARELHLRGIQAFQAGDSIDQAIAWVKEATELVPEEASYLSNLGRLYAVKGNWQKAKELWEAALQINPTIAEAHLNLGTYYTEHRDAEKSESYLKEALRLAPQKAEIHAALGHRALQVGDKTKSPAHFKQAIALDPSNIGLKQNLGAAYERLNQYPEALSCYEQVLRTSPELWQPRLFAGIIALLHGQYLPGWALFEARLNDRELYTPEIYWKTPLPKDLSGKTTYVMGEQGLGDNFQFIRFAKILKDRGARVVFIGSKSLQSLFSRISFVDEVHESLDILPGSIVVPAMSLPYALQLLEEKDLMADLGAYISADPEKVKALDSLFSAGKKSIGICWRGNPKHKWDRFRSWSLSSLKPLLERAKNSDVQIFSLQMPPYSAEESAILKEFGVISVDLKDFEETAAIIERVDKILSVDTSVAHLAGAMGRKVELWVPEVPDWRWKLEGSRCAWYSNLSIHRGDPADFLSKMQFPAAEPG